MDINLPFRMNVGTAESLILMRNLSATLKAGVPLSRALTLFEEDAPRARKVLVSHLRRSVESGRTLADAMDSAPKEFPPIAVNLVRSGELGGNLQKSLEEIVKHLRKTHELRRKIRNAMMYPTFVLCAVLGLGLSVGTLVLPELIPLFESLDVDLPPSTKVLLWMAEFFQDHGVAFSLSIMVACVAVFLATRHEKVKTYLHQLFLWMPYIRVIQRQTAIAQMATTLETLLKSGIPIHEAIPSAATSVSNRVYRKALVRCVDTINSGRPFSDALKRSKVKFPGMMTTLVDIGEETGTLTESLGYLADHYETEVDYAVKNFTTALEPIMLIGIGIIVGGTVLAIITPIYDVTGSIR